MASQIVDGSFRDPSGFVFRHQGTIYRQVNEIYRQDFDHFLSSGCYQALVDQGLLIPHREAPLELAPLPGAYRVLQPEPIPFISYPYEWCFSQLQDAALTTLRVQQVALSHGMSLKDASAFNIQFHQGKPVFIDCLSLERYREGQPWVGYRQYCQHFLAPLALMARVDVRLSRLLASYLDGIPLDLASRLLPRRTRLRPGLYLHLHLHARMQARHAGEGLERARGRSIRLPALRALLESLRGVTAGLRWTPAGTTWADYVTQTNYSQAAHAHKRELVRSFLASTRPPSVWDLGANVGEYSRLAAKQGIPTISFDLDPAAVERNYRQCRSQGDKLILPLLLDLTNPTPGLGWANQERAALVSRGHAGMVLALALIHHLAIGNNLPLAKVARYFCELAPLLVIEFVPKQDSQVQRLLASREDIFPGYTQEGFERAFGRYWQVLASEPIRESERTLYLMARRDEAEPTP